MPDKTAKPTSFYLHGADSKGLIEWWNSLNDKRGYRAQLRRASEPGDALLSEAFFNFLKHVPDSWSEPRHLCVSATVACILSHIKSIPPQEKSFAAQLGSGEKDRPVMSEMRFKQLLKSRTPEEFYKRLLRSVRLLDGTVNLISITEDILRWYDQYLYGVNRNPTDRLGVRWAHDYYLSHSK